MKFASIGDKFDSGNGIWKYVFIFFLIYLFLIKLSLSHFLKYKITKLLDIYPWLPKFLPNPPYQSFLKKEKEKVVTTIQKSPTFLLKNSILLPVRAI